MRTPPEPPGGTVLQTSDRFDTYRIEHLPEGWAIQYRDGESENGATHTNGRISWSSAWAAWGPPAGAKPFVEVPPGTPPLPPNPPEPPPPWVGMGVDASDQRLDPPPAATPAQPKRTQHTEQPRRGAGSTQGSGAAVSNASEGNAQLAHSKESLEAAMGAVAQALESVTEAQQSLISAADDSQNAAYEPAKGAVQQLVAQAEEFQQAIGAAQQAVGDVRL